MANKVPIHLTIEPELAEWAKNSNLNLSSEFEDWVKIRRGQSMVDIENESIDYDKEYARLQLELQKLQSKKEMKQKEDERQKERDMVIDHIIDNQLEYDKIEDIPKLRFKGLQFLFSKKFNETITEPQAIKLLEDRIKERGL